VFKGGRDTAKLFVSSTYSADSGALVVELPALLFIGVFCGYLLVIAEI
jgi:hypothetical protein